LPELHAGYRIQQQADGKVDQQTVYGREIIFPEFLHFIAFGFIPNKKRVTAYGLIKIWKIPILNKKVTITVKIYFIPIVSVVCTT
jgi:hypothetical protein